MGILLRLLFCNCEFCETTEILLDLYKNFHYQIDLKLHCCCIVTHLHKFLPRHSREEEE